MLVLLSLSAMERASTISGIAPGLTVGALVNDGCGVWIIVGSLFFASSKWDGVHVARNLREGAAATGPRLRFVVSMPPLKPLMPACSPTDVCSCEPAVVICVLLSV